MICEEFKEEYAETNIIDNQNEFKEEYSEPNVINGEFKEEYVEPNVIDILEALPIKTEDIGLEDIETSFLKEEYIEVDDVKEEKNNSEDENNDKSDASNDPDEIQISQNFSPEPPPQHICHLCERQFDDEIRLNNHLRTHDSAYHKCSLCDEKFRYEGGLEIHQRKLHQDEIIKCEVCAEIFTHPTDLKSHTEKHHYKRSDKQREKQNKVKDTYSRYNELLPWRCKVCKCEYNTLPKLRWHKKTHSGKKTKCDHCDYASYHPSNLRKHLKMHSEKK